MAAVRACYGAAPTEAFWAGQWAASDFEALLEDARQAPLTDWLVDALPQPGLVLEVGCGPGHVVVALLERGVSVTGIDTAPVSFEAAWAYGAECVHAHPEDQPAVTYSGVVALGVIEHDPAGPAALLRSFHRLLAPGGTLCVSVPYENVLRRLGTWGGGPIRGPVGAPFYQFRFTDAEIRRAVTDAGFRVHYTQPYGPGRMLRRALPMAARVTGRRYPRLRALLHRALPLRLVGHMLLVVATKR